MKNKELIGKLTEYFKKNSDFPTVARTLANVMIDYHRLANLDEIPEEEKRCLWARIKANDAELKDFIKNGSNKRHTLKVCSSAEEVRFEQSKNERR